MILWQILSTRARKNVVMSDIKVDVCIYGFDMLYLNGRPLLQEELKVRREVGFFSYLTFWPFLLMNLVAVLSLLVIIVVDFQELLNDQIHHLFMPVSELYFRAPVTWQLALFTKWFL